MTPKLPLVFSVTSGKGGVGKTNVSVNLACCLAGSGKKVVLLDADLGLANVDVLLGVTPRYNIFHLFQQSAQLMDILFETPYGFSILPAASGVNGMISLDTGQKLELLDAMDILEDSIDYLIVDTGAGISDNVLYFNMAAQERLVVLTPEPTSLTDAYALIKVMKLNHGVEKFRVVVNQVPNMSVAKDIFHRLHNACEYFLSGISLDLAGFIPHNSVVREAVIRQEPVVVCKPNSNVGKAFASLAETVETWQVSENLDGNIKFFWKKLLFQ